MYIKLMYIVDPYVCQRGGELIHYCMIFFTQKFYEFYIFKAFLCV